MSNRNGIPFFRASADSSDAAGTAVNPIIR
jgi:hypothetical protein